MYSEDNSVVIDKILKERVTLKNLIGDLSVPKNDYFRGKGTRDES
jgi:hypothetical protein